MIRIFYLWTFTLFAIEVDLKKTLEEVSKNNLEVKEVKWGEAFREAQLSEAKSAFFPKLEVMGIVAPMYKITGNINESSSDYGSWNPYYLLDAQLVFPIYTFGKAFNYKKAAIHGIEVAKSETHRKLLDTIYQTKEYYYQYLLAKTMFKEAKSAKSILEEAMAKAEKLVKKNKIKKQDLLKLKVYYAQGMEKYELVKKGLILAKAVLLTQMGYPQSESINVKEKKIEPTPLEFKTLEEYTALAKKHRPEYKMAEAGVQATDYLVKAERANHFPNFFVGAQLKYRYTKSVTDQESVFVKDDYNDVFPGVGIGFQWKWDYGTTSAKVRQKQAEHMKVVEKSRYATIAIPMDVKRAYYDVKEAKNNLEHLLPGMKAAKEWKVIEMANFAIGITEAKDLLEAIGADVLSKFAYYNSVLKYNMAVANLSKSVGVEVSQI